VEESENPDRLLVHDCEGNVLFQPKQPPVANPSLPSFHQDERKMLHVCSAMNPRSDCSSQLKVPIKNLRTGRYYFMVSKRMPEEARGEGPSAQTRDWTMNVSGNSSEKESEEE